MDVLNFACRSRSAWWSARIVFAVALASATWAMAAHCGDDVFIHLRIARNFALTGEPYFNAGERVMGGSSPLWMLLLTAVFKISGQATVDGARALASVSAVALMLAAETFVRRVSGMTWLAVLVGIASAMLALSYGTVAMESALAVAFLLGGGWAIAAGRVALAGVLLGFAAATRFEFFVAPLLTLLVVENRRRFACGFLPVLVAEVAFLGVYYGTVLPNTMRAKAIVYQLSWEQFFLQLNLPGGGFWLVAMVAGGLIAAAQRCWRLRDGRSAAALVILATAAAIFSTWLIRRAFVFTWYVPLVTVPAFAGAAAVVLQHWTDRGTKHRGRAFLALSGALGLVSIAYVAPTLAQNSAQAFGALTRRTEPNDELVANARTVGYSAIGSQIAELCGRDATVMAAEIGALGWSYPGRVMDGLGLVSPEMLKYHPLHVPTQRQGGMDGALPAMAVVDLQPDVVVALDLFSTDLIWNAGKHAHLASSYRVQAFPVFHPSIRLRMPDSLWGAARSILVFYRNGSCGH